MNNNNLNDSMAHKYGNPRNGRHVTCILVWCLLVNNRKYHCRWRDETTNITIHNNRSFYISNITNHATKYRKRFTQTVSDLTPLIKVFMTEEHYTKIRFLSYGYIKSKQNGSKTSVNMMLTESRVPLWIRLNLIVTSYPNVCRIGTWILETEHW